MMNGISGSERIHRYGMYFDRCNNSVKICTHPYINYMFVETGHFTALLQSAQSLHGNQSLGMNPQASSHHRFAVSK